LLENPRRAGGADPLKGGFLGPRYSNDAIRQFLNESRIPYHFVPDELELLRRVVEAIRQQQVVGWFQGRMEFGPRALGGRSILGDARDERMQSVMNLRIKYRESFRPFAPCVLREDVERYFELDRESPYMLLVAGVRPELRCPLTPEQQMRMRDPDLRQRVNVKRSTLPAITHVDMSARIQTVDAARHGRFHRLMQEFKRQTGCGVMINTSFNIRGEPIVCTPQDACRCFLATDMDVLVLENCVLYKREQPQLEAAAKKDYVDAFKLD
jgi:carbamoyltransferase